MKLRSSSVQSNSATAFSSPVESNLARKPRRFALRFSLFGDRTEGLFHRCLLFAVRLRLYLFLVGTGSAGSRALTQSTVIFLQGLALPRIFQMLLWFCRSVTGGSGDESFDVHSLLVQASKYHSTTNTLTCWAHQIPPLDWRRHAIHVELWAQLPRLLAV